MMTYTYSPRRYLIELEELAEIWTPRPSHALPGYEGPARKVLAIVVGR